jgi:AmmeMemoRadiSam system protein A
MNEPAPPTHEAKSAANQHPLTPTEQQMLLALARAELRSYFGLAAGSLPAPGGNLPVAADLPAALRRPAGVFVTLHAHGDLRGCLGSLVAGAPLAEAVQDLVVAAATRDPRFPPVTARDVAELIVEISVLGDPAPLTCVAQVHPGRHGLIVSRDAARGVLLPQVAVEQGWDGPAFLSQTCTKAGVPADSWHAWDRGEDDDFSVLAFTAQVFSEAG